MELQELFKHLVRKKEIMKNMKNKKEQKGFLIETGAENPDYSRAIDKLQTLIDGIK